MPETALPAREMLKLPGETGIAWAVFDASWYLVAHPDARTELVGADAAAVLRFYLEHGQRRGHSPNVWFDEAWHLKMYPGPAAAVRDGHAESGFDTYCRAGYRFRSPHWLFQERAYRQRHPDLREDALATDGHVNGYDHFLRHGSREGRIGHTLFDPTVYRAQLDADEQRKADAVGGYLHYLPLIWQRAELFLQRCKGGALRIGAERRREVLPFTQVISADGENHLERIEVRVQAPHEAEKILGYDADAVFVMIGADASTLMATRRFGAGSKRLSLHRARHGDSHCFRNALVSFR